MPQFDIITFFLQTFWLLLFFFAFYALIVHYFIPKLAAVLKTRTKKLGVGAIGLFYLNKEQLTTAEAKNLLIQDYASNSSNKINHMLSNSTDGFGFYVMVINYIMLPYAQTKYLTKSASTIAKQHSSIQKSVANATLPYYF